MTSDFRQAYRDAIVALCYNVGHSEPDASSGAEQTQSVLLNAGLMDDKGCWLVDPYDETEILRRLDERN